MDTPLLLVPGSVSRKAISFPKRWPVILVRFFFWQPQSVTDPQKRSSWLAVI
jgi:hypothetical protein